LSEVEVGRITSNAPFKGQMDAVETALGFTFPAPNRVTSHGDARLVWTGPGRVFLTGADAPDLGDDAAVTDQTDAWVTVQLNGADAVNVLARLVPVDLRPAHFKPGHTARAMLAHMYVSVIHDGDDAFQILAMRSMAQTLVHDVTAAMKAVAARG